MNALQSQKHTGVPNYKVAVENRLTILNAVVMIQKIAVILYVAVNVPGISSKRVGTATETKGSWGQFNFFGNKIFHTGP